MTERNDAEAIIQAMEKYHQVLPINTITEAPYPNGAALVSVPHGVKIESLKPLLDEYLVKPERREGTATLETVDSFCRYMNRFKNEHSIVFATERDSLGEPGLRGVIDHHEAGDDLTAARFCKHRALYKFPMSDEWNAWDEANDSEMSQEDFAEFLEDRLLDVIDPSTAGPTAKDFAEQLRVKLATPAELLDLSKGLAVHIGATAAQQVNTQTGESSLSFSEEHNDAGGQPLVVPGGFVIGIPVFRGGAAYQLCARLRYRVRGSVTWTIKLHRSDLVFRHAFEEACDHVEAETSLPVLQGSPES